MTSTMVIIFPRVARYILWSGKSGQSLGCIRKLTDFRRAISRDPDLYPDPEAFNPLRWIKPEYPTYQEPLSQ